MVKLSDLQTPALIVDRAIVKKNADDMIQLAKRLNVSLRPHVKTHKTKEIAEYQLGGSFNKIVVSTLDEAESFFAAGFKDILYAVPFPPQKLKKVKSLCKLGTFHIMVDNEDILDFIESSSFDSPLSVFLSVDTGYGREGVDPRSPRFLPLAKRLSEKPNYNFQGLYCHSGHAYGSVSVDALHAIIEEEILIISNATQLLRDNNIKVEHVSIGSTPAIHHLLSHPIDTNLVTEIHPGNYVFLDRQQVDLGAAGVSGASISDVAVSVLTSVISYYPERNSFLVDVGALSLSKDTCGNTGYGYILDHPELILSRISQEVGVIQRKDGQPLDKMFKLGQQLRIVPNHSCLAAACFLKYYVVDSTVENGERVIDVWTAFDRSKQ